MSFLVMLSCGLLLFVTSVICLVWRGTALAVRMRRVRHHKCVLCGYSRDSLPSDTVCPECGTHPSLTKKKLTFRRRAVGFYAFAFAASVFIWFTQYFIANSSTLMLVDFCAYWPRQAGGLHDRASEIMWERRFSAEEASQLWRQLSNRLQSAKPDSRQHEWYLIMLSGISPYPCESRAKLFDSIDIDFHAEADAAMGSPIWGFQAWGPGVVFVPQGIDQAEIMTLAMDMQEDAASIPYGDHRQIHDEAAIQYHMQSGQSLYSYTAPIMNYFLLYHADYLRPALTKEERIHLIGLHFRSNPGKQ